MIGANGAEHGFSDSISNHRSGNYDAHRFIASDYPPDIKFIRIWIDPSRTRDAGAGTLDLTLIRSFGCEFHMGNVGGNALNCILDRMDYGIQGITVTGGTLGVPVGFDDAISASDTDTLGIITADRLDGALKIGGVATVFRDENFAIKGGNQPLAASDWVRIDFDASNGAEDILIGFGFLERVHLTFSGTSATQADIGGLILSTALLPIIMSPAWSWSGSIINSPQLSQNGTVLDGLVVDGGTDIIGIVRSLAGSYDGGEVKNCNRGMDVTALINGSNEVSIDGTVFSGNTIDITLSHAVDVDILVSNGAVVSTAENTGAGGVTIVSSLNYEITGLDQNSIVTIVDITIPASPVELFNEVVGVDGIISYTFDGLLAGTAIGVYIGNTTIKFNEFDDVLPSSDVSFPAGQLPDSVYI